MPKILLVDDDSELVAMLTTYLEREGFEVVMMPRSSGIEALTRIRAHSPNPAPRAS